MQQSLLPAEEGETTAAVSQAAPLINAAPQLLWTGFAAFLAIFIVVFFLLSRWRADRRNRTTRKTEFFQPAGEGAEITFDEADAHAASPVVEAPTEEIFAAEPPKKKKGPFAALFGKREKAASPDPDPPVEVIELGAEDEAFASVRIERPQQSVFGAHPPKEPAADWAAIERADAEAARRFEAEEAEARRLRQEEDNRRRAIEDERRRHAEEERRRAERDAAARLADMERSRTPAAARAPEPDRHGTHEDIVRTLSEVEEALHAQREAIQAETKSLLDSFARRFSDRLDALASSVEKRSQQRPDAPASERPGDAAQLAEIIARRLDDHQREIGQSLAVLAKRVDAAGQGPDASGLRDEMAKLRRALVGAASPSAPAVQLADVVRNALAPSAYEFNATLPGGKRADCLIKLARPPGPIAIDARFPVEAFHALAEGGRDAESEFRRAALRHIVDVAERLIAPGATADSALLFLPSETMVAELHARFPDVVQDSWRARVWIVSPTGLMATLHTLSGLLREAAGRALSAQHSDAQRALAEVERLSERIAALESRGRPAAVEQAMRREPSYDEEAGLKRMLATAAADNDEGPNGDLYSDDRSLEDEPAPERTRPPFPLR